MKKLSISLFAVLAIAFAVFSAFTTTKGKPFADDRFQILGINPDQVDVDPTPPYDYNTVTGQINFTMYDNISEIQNVTPATGDWQAELNFTEGATFVGLTYPINKSQYDCSTTDLDDLCVAYVRDDRDGVAPLDLVLAVIPGDVSFQ